MSSKMHGKTRAGLLVMIFLAVAKQTDGQAFLLTYSDERGTKIAQKTVELTNSTANITEVYTVTTSTRIPSEFSQTTMDAITVVWYVSTFIALMAFFFLMGCSDRRCGNPEVIPPAEDQPQQPPPTPAPSYSEFAPPSYDTVTKDYPSVFVVQVPYVDPEKEKDPPPPFTFHTINELQKINV